MIDLTGLKNDTHWQKLGHTNLHMGGKSGYTSFYSKSLAHQQRVGSTGGNLP